MNPDPTPPASRPIPEETTLVVIPVTDPITRAGHKAREPAYRLRLALKDLLRKYGLRVVVMRNPTPEELVATRPNSSPLVPTRKSAIVEPT